MLPRLIGYGPTRPVLLLLVSVLVAGCATTRPASAPPTSVGSWSPSGPAVSAQPVPSRTPTGTPTARPAPSATGLPYAFPVRARKVGYHPTHSAYPGTDIFADCGEPFVAVTDGEVLEVSRVDRFDPKGPKGPYNGGLSVALLGDDGVRYYGSHLSVIADGVTSGVRVRSGQQLGLVGRTGNANNVCHLHFGISPPCPGKDGWWIRRGVVWPARYLDAWRRGVGREPAAEVRAWHRKHGCPPAPTSAN
ncbi:Peptidase family M23 [Micromonospora pallida]|uniref:Peptidase family M23 n=1 Tax=Micromonospora pallida TaxID=145854 RepID=A0A1C6TDX2_9ACTN|nr:M23 family metallopeptidase [Micromonospora pallida]SCL39703.1 Peptidase family M23 [Micromonospora pallida]